MPRNPSNARLLQLLLLQRGIAIPKYYIATTGNDSTGDGTQLNPWATITKALATVPTDEACQIRCASGTYDENTSGLGYLFVNQQFAETVTVMADTGANVTITNASGTTYTVRFNSGAKNITFRDVIITPSGASHSNGTIYYLNSAFENLTFENCTIECKSGIGAVQIVASSSTMTNLTFRNSTIRRNSSSSTACRALLAQVGATGYIDVNIINCNIQGTGTTNLPTIEFEGTASGADADILINGGTYTNTSSGAVLESTVGNALLRNAIFSGSTGYGLVIGEEGATTDTCIADVDGCTISSVSSHAVLFGHGSDGSTIDDSNITGGDLGLVFKRTDGCSANNCTIDDGTTGALLFKGATNCSATNCEISNDSGDCVRVLEDDADGTDSGDITLTDNTITATGSADIFNWGGDTQDSGGSICDRNTYDISGTSGNLGSVRNDADVEDLTQLQAAWSDYDVTTNDSNSTVIT